MDGSGKTTLSQLIYQKLNTGRHRGYFKWTKEPTFSSEDADRLNLKGMDSANREVEFLMDRILHQEFLTENKFVICDRYIWSGLAYCKIFNPSVYEFATTVYQHMYFRKPDLYVFVDTPPSICCQRRHVPAQLSNLINLRQAYIDTKPFITGSEILTVDGTKDLDTLTDEVMLKIKELSQLPTTKVVGL